MVPTARKGRSGLPSTHQVQPRASLLINDNYCVNSHLSRILAGSKQTLNVNQCHQTRQKTVNCIKYNHTGPESGKTLKTGQPVTHFTNSVVVTHAHIVKGQPQKKGISPTVVRHQSLQYANNVYCADHLRFENHVPNVQNVASDLIVGARLHQFWKTWEALGARLKVLKMLKEGYTLPFRTQPN